MSFAELIQQYGMQYLQSLLTTYKLTAISFVLALLLGVIITVLRISPIKPLKIFGDIYVELFRNIPGMCLLVIFVYAFPYLSFVWDYDACVLICTTLIPSSFCSEYLLSGINTIDPGQVEAARSLGMNFFQIVKNVIIPQALRSSVLQLTNLLVATMLTTSLASQVPGSLDLTGIVNYINNYDVGGVTAFLISAIFYCISGVFIGLIGNFIDKKVRILR